MKDFRAHSLRQRILPVDDGGAGVGQAERCGRREEIEEMGGHEQRRRDGGDWVVKEAWRVATGRQAGGRTGRGGRLGGR